MLSLPSRHRRTLVLVALPALLAVMVLQLVMLARANSCTWDEADHTYAGYMQWHGDFGLNPEHPPLVKFLATLPLLTMNLKVPALQDRPYRLQEVDGGREFVFGNDANALLFRAHMATMLLTVLLAWLTFACGREMFGAGAGLLALGLIAFDPTLLAHSALVTTDSGQACFMLWSVYAFYRYTTSPSAWRLITAGSAMGLALAAKHSAVLLLPTLLLLAIAEAVLAPQDKSRRSTTGRGRRFVRLATALLAMIAIAVFVLWSFYGFRYAARPQGVSLNPVMSVQLHRVPSTLQQTVLAGIDRWHLLPESYTYGLAHVLYQSKAFTSYLLGAIYPHPVWFYFPIAMLIKSTLTFLVLLGVALGAIVTGKVGRRRELLYLGVPAAVYMLFAMAGGMNIGVRHILPVYVFLSVAIAGCVWTLVQRDRRWMYVVVALLVFQGVSVLHAFPAYVAYANEAAGGPSHVHTLLSDSSSDWGQQMKSVKRYLDAGNVKHCWFAYFGEGVADYSYYGIPCRPLITADSLYFDAPHDVPPVIDGPVLMSAGVLSGFEFGPGALNPYRQFQQLKPDAVIDDGVFVYSGRFAIPVASALSHVQKSGVLLSQKNVQAALEEAMQAEHLAPESATVNAALGRAYDANRDFREADPYYRRALQLAQGVEPAFQRNLVRELQTRLAQPPQP